MGFKFRNGYIVVVDEDTHYEDHLVFFTLKDIREYFDITHSQLAAWRDEDECPEREDLSMIMDCTVIDSRERKGDKTEGPLQSIYSFRTSKDGDHWNKDEGGFFSSVDKLVLYVEYYIPDICDISDEDLYALCERLRKDQYAKWVNPEDKKDKMYVKIDRMAIDIQYG